MIRPPRFEFFKQELQLSDKTIVDWSSFCREVCVMWLEAQQNPIGGKGIVVEIDEAKIGKRKYNRGRLVTGKWIFGGFERGTGKAFIVPVKNRTAETLLSVIKQWILPKTTIISDMWRAYDCLNNEGFIHLTVNHSMNFVDPETGAHTQNIERTWREVRANIPRYGTREKHLIGYMAEFFFKRQYKFDDRIVSFFEAVGKFFPPGSNTTNP
ncbi:uncharacterized protein LOC112638075 [Camponotus floridanus]|uniref:uncharacterized protein LOC112638075 n=1 Tax=Camponotus floridanus TaxID=104421 RepID=UPI000DC6C014|nr:uncharacterized protein LOC112638075 [Camponotus floridanus]